MTLTYNDEDHSYQLDGRPVPSVTEIVGLLTARKYSDANAAMLQQAQRRGTAVHELCEAIDCGVDPEDLDIEPELVGYVNAYLAFLRDWRPEWLYIEKPLYTLDYAGRCDRIGIIARQVAVVEIKTTGTMDRLSRLALLFQLFFYRDAFLFSLYDPEKIRRPKALLGVQLKKDGTYTVHEAQKIMDKDLPRWDLYRVMDSLLELTQLIGGYKTHE